MDFSGTPYFSGFWIFPLLCLLFMAVMMIGCGSMRFRFGRGARRDGERETARQILERRYASGELGKEEYDAMRREVTG